MVYAYALGVSFVVSAALTELVRCLALRWGVLDHPGERKIHAAPVPLLGGVAICFTFFIMIGAHLLLLLPARQFGSEWLESHVLSFLGANVWAKLAGLSLGGLLVFILGVVDDLKVLTPEKKLIGQVIAAGVTVACGVRLDLFIPNVWVSGAITVFWIVAMTNAMNFLDNMDGLSSGVAVISAFSFFLCVLPHGETFICALLMVFAGAVAGFLYHNLSPARIFMGDAGSMFCGFILGTVAVLATFYTEHTPSRIAVVAPLLALSVPIFDTLSVVYIRWSRGESIMKGDKRHFSHRLVDLGMTPRQAVEFIFLVAAVTGLGAALLPQVGLTGTYVILGQTIGVFLLIILLMKAAANKNGIGKS
ncbi:MAG: undecaprenyl/decaprenyl-phosphate alpha-N-acetylglucosaminyl 1-phosphate transferase [Candidatus Hydrogenedentes bacterium]|nr:undecaprenyl/decaprenyl-phosphate alpha-N-acetylglucosaminyl 1-phosphate transferase [Candidatus Hydrogenedentota bacterium]